MGFSCHPPGRDASRQDNITLARSQRQACPMRTSYVANENLGEVTRVPPADSPWSASYARAAPLIEEADWMLPYGLGAWFRICKGVATLRRDYCKRGVANEENQAAALQDLGECEVLFAQ